MIPRRLRVPPEPLYPDDEWCIVETALTEDWLGNAETVFALSNGFIGIRGLLEEARPSVESGTFLNGFHETWPIVHAEQAYGFARTGQTIVNAPDVTILRLAVDGESLFLPMAHLDAYERVLDLREGVLRRSLVWRTSGGKRVTVCSTRMVSLEHRHIGVMSLKVEVDADASVVIASQVLNRQDAHQDADALDEERVGRDAHDPRRARVLTERVLMAQAHVDEDARLITGYRTTRSGMTMSVGVDHRIVAPVPVRTAATWSEDRSDVVIDVQTRSGVPIRVEKYFTYHTSPTVPAVELVDRARRSLDQAVDLGLDALHAGQRTALDRFWQRADITLSGPPRYQQAVRWNLFQLHQASAQAETSGIPAKGLTGQAYEGHYFWDTEIYVTPFLSYTEPRLTRDLLRFREAMLPKARERAAELSEQGALFPWRTINGEEASSYYAAGTAQYHIDADIAYALRKYVDVSGDDGLLLDLGADILASTARMWAGLGFLSPDDDRFHIHGVTGPDEYTTVVNDNVFTNLMARRNLRDAADVIERLGREDPAAHAALTARLDLAAEEPDRWRHCADAMYVPFDADRGIHPQDDSFLEKEVWDFAHTPMEHYPLLLHYHPLVIYRHQVIKQADVVLAMFLLGDEFSLEQKRRNFDYYDPLTTGDSSLSACVQAILAAEIGYAALAEEYFRYALLMDLADVNGNVVDGVHVASTGGVWMAMTYGFGGMRDHGGVLRFDPRLPSSWEHLSFPLRFRGRTLRVTLRSDRIRLVLEQGEELEVTVRDEPILLGVGVPVERTVASRWRSPTESPPRTLVLAAGVPGGGSR